MFLFPKILFTEIINKDYKPIATNKIVSSIYKKY